MSIRAVIDAIEDMMEARERIPEDLRKHSCLEDTAHGRAYLKAKDDLAKELDWLLRSRDD